MFAIRAFMGVATAALFVQAQTVASSYLDPNSSMSLLQEVEKITLDGALVIAVVVLWKAASKKEELLVQATKTMTETLVTVNLSNIEVRKALEESTEAKRDLVSALNSLKENIAILPCSLDKKHRG